MMKVMKFGGSSLADASRIAAVAEIIRTEAAGASVVIVLSAMKGVTDTLLAAADLAENADAEFHSLYERVFDTHENAIKTLFADETDVRSGSSTEFTHSGQLMGELTALHHELGDILHGIELVRECSPRSRDLIAGFGERMSCTLVSAYLSFLGEKAVMVDARRVIVTEAEHGAATVRLEKSFERARALIHHEQELPIVTGFIAATEDGITTTLGRNGSDYTASLLGAGLHADVIEIWTDVDGVLSADPRYVEDAFVIPTITVEEAMELAYFGAEVLHPYTMLPAIERRVPIRIKNTLNPKAPGTLITHEAREEDRGVDTITGIASIGDVALINVEGGGMVGIPGIASRVFSALGSAGVNIIMISQASSEHSICVVCRRHHAQPAIKALERELAHELESRRIGQLELIPNLEIVAVIGACMRGTPGIAGRIFSALGKSKVNILAIAQGSSEMNISFVVEMSARKQVLNVVHSAFFTRSSDGTVHGTPGTEVEA